MTVIIDIIVEYRAQLYVIYQLSIQHIYIDVYNNRFNNIVNIPIFVFDKYVLFTIILIIVCSVFFKSQLDETKIY